MKKEVNNIFIEIKNILENARNNIYRVANSAMVLAYWQIGKIIVEHEQKGKERAEYGSSLIKELSIKLSKEFGKGFDERNLWYIRNFYLMFPIMNAVRSELSWTHYRLLLSIENKEARNFYIIETANNKWSTRELERQINSMFYEKLVLSKNKEKVKELSAKGQIISKPSDVIKDPYFLEFANLKENRDYLEKDLENVLISKLQEFLLELGKGFSFVARQKRITINNQHYYIDLVSLKNALHFWCPKNSLNFLGFTIIS